MAEIVNKEYRAASEQTNAVKHFLGEMKDAGTSSAAFDSVDGSADFASQMLSNEGDLPKSVQAILDHTNKQDAGRILSAAYDAVAQYEKQHGVTVPPDVFEQALHNAASPVFDSISGESTHSNNTSLVPEHAVVSIHSTLVAAVPFAHYAPGSIKSNEARIALLRNRAGSDTGMFAKAANLDGVNSGETFMGQVRAHTVLAVNGTGNSTLTGKITNKMTARDVCDQTAAGVPTRAGRSIVLFKGIPVAVETPDGSSIAGAFTDEGTPYNIGGNVDHSNGSFALTVTPQIAAGAEFIVESIMDTESDSNLIPSFEMDVLIKAIFASSWTAKAKVTKEAGDQMRHELGVSPMQASMIAINAQFANERHYHLLQLAYRIAKHRSFAFNFDYSARKGNMILPEMFRDLLPVIALASQSMVEKTNFNGVTHAYVGPKMLPYFYNLPEDMFTPSGISIRPGIFRVGRFANGIEVYYTPKGLNQTNTSAEVLLIGRADDVARSAFVMGDVTPPTTKETAVEADLAAGLGFHARNFTGLNPHKEVLESAALITITNLPEN